MAVSECRVSLSFEHVKMSVYDEVMYKKSRRMRVWGARGEQRRKLAVGLERRRRSRSSASGSGKSRMTLSSDPDHEIILVPPLGQSDREQLLQECYDIRINVFHHEQGYSLNAVFDELSLIGPATIVARSVIKGFCLFLLLRAD